MEADIKLHELHIEYEFPEWDCKFCIEDEARAEAAYDALKDEGKEEDYEQA